MPRADGGEGAEAAFAAHGEILTGRVYAPAPEGRRFLVDRLWPRGLRREALSAQWLPEVAPSAELRRWFGHDPSKWEEFQRRYAAELDARRHSWAPIATAAAGADVVLLHAAADEEHNNAVALAAYLRARLGEAEGPAGGTSGPSACCARCGATAPSPPVSPPVPVTWTLTVAGRARSSWLCETCTRGSLRALEARLSEEWW